MNEKLFCLIWRIFLCDSSCVRSLSLMQTGHLRSDFPYKRRDPFVNFNQSPCFKLNSSMKVLALIVIIASSWAEEGFENISVKLEVLPDKSNVVPRIVNGRPALTGQFPHQALVFINTLQGNFQCGGSLISSVFVMSAAHCIIG